MNHAAFEVGFCAPFRPAWTRNSRADSRACKRSEIAINGWTLSVVPVSALAGFGRMVPSSFLFWRTDAIGLLLTQSGALDPAEVGGCLRTTDCQSLPARCPKGMAADAKGIRVPHPFRGKRRQASAFVVQAIIHPVNSLAPPAIEWLFKGQWQQRPVPTRGEYLIRLGGTTPMRPFRAVLELRAPYLALVSADAAQQSAMTPAHVEPPCISGAG